MVKYYSAEEAKSILAKLKNSDLDELHSLFGAGTVPLFEEIRGKTLGVFLAWNPANPWLIKFPVRILFDSPIAHWTGKEFLSHFGVGKQGRGVNLFRNRILPHRFKFDTYIKKAYSDQKPCLALDYRPYFSLMAGLVDDVRKINDGVLLGQMYYKFPWKRGLQFLGYFALCALIR